jgi:hypothetical protein
MASLAEVAARDPSDIINMFAYQGTAVENGVTVGVYTVRFYDAHNNSPVYVTVDTELPSSGSYYDHPINGVLWVALAEKAYAEANGQGYVTTGNIGSDSYAALNSGYASWALHAITGRAASDFSINPANIAAAWNAGELIVIGTGGSTADSRIVTGHAYAVVGYNPSSTMPFEIFNPWGTDANGWVPNHANQIYGLFWASAGAVSANFVGQSIGSGAAAEGVSCAPLEDAAQAFLPHRRANVDADLQHVANVVLSRTGFVVNPTAVQPAPVSHDAHAWQAGYQTLDFEVSNDVLAAVHLAVPSLSPASRA